MLIKAAHRGYNTGFMKDICPERVISLQYADDTLLFLEYNESCMSLKVVNDLF
jgi:hypothetical protein